MRKVQTPKCSCCDHASREFESDVWPGFGLCFTCWRDIAKWFVTQDLADENPVAEELLSGVWTQMPCDGYYEVVYESSYSIHASSYRRCKRVGNGDVSFT
jgi:hypothetical protein